MLMKLRAQHGFIRKSDWRGGRKRLLTPLHPGNFRNLIMQHTRSGQR
jgi:hypothetical protein